MGSVEHMRQAVRSLELTLRRLRFERAKDQVLSKHAELFRRLAENERAERVSRP